jgi:hypothetical protein
MRTIPGDQTACKNFLMIDTNLDHNIGVTQQKVVMIFFKFKPKKLQNKLKKNKFETYFSNAASALTLTPNLACLLTENRKL